MVVVLTQVGVHGRDHRPHDIVHVPPIDGLSAPGAHHVIDAVEIPVRVTNAVIRSVHGDDRCRDRRRSSRSCTTGAPSVATSIACSMVMAAAQRG